MTLRHRRILWYGDATKQARLSEILRDPVLREAIDLHFAESRSLYQDVRDAIPDLLMSRKHAENGGGEMLLQSLERFSTPLPKPDEDLSQDPHDEWAHLVPTTTHDTP